MANVVRILLPFCWKVRHSFAQGGMPALVVRMRAVRNMNTWSSHGSTDVLSWRFQTEVQARAPPLRANTWHRGRSQQTAFQHPDPGTHVGSHFLSRRAKQRCGSASSTHSQLRACHVSPRPPTSFPPHPSPHPSQTLRSPEPPECPSLGTLPGVAMDTGSFSFTGDESRAR